MHRQVAVGEPRRGVEGEIDRARDGARDQRRQQRADQHGGSGQAEDQRPCRRRQLGGLLAGNFAALNLVGDKIGGGLEVGVLRRRVSRVEVGGGLSPRLAERTPR